MKWLTAIVLCAGMAIPALPAQAKVPGPNGQIAFSRYVQDDNTVTYTVNPDGSHMQQLFPGFSGGPRWSPDGSQVSVFAACTDGEENCAATIVDPDTGRFRQFKWPDPTLETPLRRRLVAGWHATALRVLRRDRPEPQRHLHHPGIRRAAACGGSRPILVAKTSRATTRPTASGSCSTASIRAAPPTRTWHSSSSMWMAAACGGSPPWGLPFWEDGGRWSPDGTTILFDNRKSLFVVRPDGSGLAKIPLVTHSFSRLQNPNWSPDGTKIVVSLFTRTSPGTEQAGIYTANADGSNIQRVTNSPTFDRDGDWGPHPLAS